MEDAVDEDLGEDEEEVPDKEVFGDGTTIDPDEDLALGRVEVKYMEEGFGKVG